MANKIFETARAKILNGIRVKPNRTKASETDFDPDDSLSKTLMENDTTDISDINKFRQLSGDRNEQYNAFDEMEKDSVIAAALKMYADDATQYNLDGNVIWVESADPNVAAFGNRLIEVLKLNENAWSHIYNLVKYGDIYLETFYDDEPNDSTDKNRLSGNYGTSVFTHQYGSRIEEYVEMVANPACIFDLKMKGKTQGFLKISDDELKNLTGTRYTMHSSSNMQTILPADKYVHIMTGNVSCRYPETFEIDIVDPNSKSGYITNSYVVAKGKSMLEDVFKSFREVSLMEDSVLLNRVTRTAITRILQVEVGDMPKNQVREKLRQIKMMIEQRNFMDKNSGTFASQAAPGPVDNIIYVPTRNGNGSITMQAIGGDVDPKSLIDIEYYQQKEAGGLGIPLSYLKAQSGDGGGLSSGTALTKLDNRYARSVKRLQIAYTQGIQTLLNIFAIRKGLTEYVNNFKVRMLSPSTIEDNDRDEQLNNRVGMLRDLVDILGNDQYSPETIKSIITYMTSTFLNKPEVAAILEQDEVENDEDTFDADMSSKGFDIDVHNSIEPLNSDNDYSSDFEDTLSSGIDLTTTPEPSESTADNGADFGDFEDFA